MPCCCRCSWDRVDRADVGVIQRRGGARLGGFAGDELVPGYSQDMNNLPSLHGSSSVIITSAGHTLVAEDGTTLLQILNELYATESEQHDSVT